MLHRRLSAGLLIAAALAALASQAAAAPPALKPGLAGLDFLVGAWSSGTGKVAETGETSTGSCVITVEAGGAALLRRDHTDLADATGKPHGGFDQIMLIYPEAGSVHGDYSDGSHVIHYTSAQVTPGRSVAFTGAAAPGTPTFRLTYTLLTPKTLSVAFAMAAPGSADFLPIATGSLKKASR